MGEYDTETFWSVNKNLQNMTKHLQNMPMKKKKRDERGKKKMFRNRNFDSS